MAEHYVVIGLANSRSAWFGEVARWSMSGAEPIEFLKCLSTAETAAVLGAGRRVSALLVDGSLPRFDRDLVAAVEAAGAIAIMVDDGRMTRDWESLGCTAVLDADFSGAALMEILHRHADTVDRTERLPARVDLANGDGSTIGRLIGVTGAGGCGASTLAMALAQSLGSTGLDPGTRGRRRRHREAPSDGEAPTVALIDGVRRSDLAMYHDVGDVLPGLVELVEAHRADRPDPDEIRHLLYGVPSRGYDLLLGLCRSRDWAALRPRAVAASINGMRRSYDIVVVDHDPDVEGEAETGSVDVEERHALTRTVVDEADLLLVVSRPGVKGLHDLVRLTSDLCDAGAPAERVVPVINQTPRNPAVRAELSRAFHQLIVHRHPSPLAPVLFVRGVRLLEDCHRSASMLPSSIAEPLGDSVAVLVDRLGRRPRPAATQAFRRLLPGELGIRVDVDEEVA